MSAEPSTSGPPPPRDPAEVREEPQRPHRSIKRGVDRWRALRAERAAASPPGQQISVEGDQALRAIDELLASPLGRAWLPDLAPEGAVPGSPPDGEGIIAPLPRRKLIAHKAGHGAPAMARAVTFRATNLAAIARLFAWTWGIFRFFAGNFFDLLRGRDTIENRAVRLRRLFERSGPTLVKLGQQLSLRADLLPYAYCEELSKMLDSVPPFTVKEAMATIERATRQPIAKTFTVFDPQPIGSASIACVYQAILTTGEKVAVKVRRPKIGERFAADLRAMEWMMIIAENLTIIRDGITRNLRSELRDMLMEELDFTREARNTELFRSRARDQNQKYVTAPRVFFDLLSEEVLVTEFVSGVFMWEILSALDREDQEALSQLRARGIDPVVLAKRMLEIFNWETLENLIFHADPHSANIIVRPGNTIVFIDFGSVGHFPARNRRLWQQLYTHLENEDVTGVVAATISLMEPLPPIDLHRFMKEVESHYRDWFYALKSDHSEWWERSSGVLWLKLVGVAQRYSVPFALDTLRLFRTLFAADAIMYRLWAKLDREAEFRKYRDQAGKRARKRIRKAIAKRVREGLQPDDYLRIEELWRMSNQIDEWIQHRLDTPSHRFADALGKAAFAVTIVMRVVTVAFFLHAIGFAGVFIYLYANGLAPDFGAVVGRIVASEVYQISLAAVVLILIRRMRMRFEDVDV